MDTVRHAICFIGAPQLINTHNLHFDLRLHSLCLLLHLNHVAERQSLCFAKPERDAPKRATQGARDNRVHLWWYVALFANFAAATDV